MVRYLAVSFCLVFAVALLSGCAELSTIDQRLHRVETITRYNHDRIEALSHRVSGIEGQALSPVQKASLERRTFPITLRFEEVSSRDPAIASAKPDLRLFFTSGVYELTPSQKKAIKRLLSGGKVNGSRDLSVTINAFSSRGRDPERDYHLSASRGLAVYNFILKSPSLVRIKEVSINACGVQFATGRRVYDRRVDVIVNGSGRQKRKS